MTGTDRRGLFITLEGGEGAGKSTHGGRLAAALKAAGHDVLLTREPGGAPGAEAIRDLLVHGEPGRWGVIAEALLFYAARAEHLERTIRPALVRGTHVICDRFTDSTHAYQGYARGLDLGFLRLLDEAVVGMTKPDLTLLLDLPVAAGLARAAERGGAARFEKFDVEFHQKLRDAYLLIARKNPTRCAVIDAMLPQDDVAAAIRSTLTARLGITFQEP